MRPVSVNSQAIYVAIRGADRGVVAGWHDTGLSPNHGSPAQHQQTQADEDQNQYHFSVFFTSVICHAAQSPAVSFILIFTVAEAPLTDNQQSTGGMHSPRVLIQLITQSSFLIRNSSQLIPRASA